MLINYDTIQAEFYDFLNNLELTYEVRFDVDVWHTLWVQFKEQLEFSEYFDEEKA